MTRAALLILIACIAGVGVSGACKVPVFRYALERWEADSYRAVVLFRGSDHGDTVGPLAEVLRGAANANLEVELLDLDALTTEQQWQYANLEDLGAEPLLRLYYPYAAKIEAPFWEGPLTADTVARTLDSPRRRELVASILAGSSTTWVLLETGDPAADAPAFARLQELLAAAAATLTIPEGVVRAEDVSADGTTPDGLPLEMDDVLRTGIPLKIAFPVLRLASADPREAIFRAMLTGFAGAGQRRDAPLAVAVFGRGRALEGIPASRLEESSIRAACAYLCGECSCQVKDQNPGIDLLLEVDWSAKLQGSFVILERELPELAGIGIEIPAEEVPLSAAPSEESGNATGFRLPRSVIYTLGGLLGAALFGTYLMSRRQSG